MNKNKDPLYEPRWEEHLRAMRNGSESLLSALKREHPRIIRVLTQKKEQP